MVANGLIFLLGFLAALLLALLFAPVLWRKAQRFARREFEATMPISANEIRAEFDAVRAQAAMDVRRGEMAAAEMRARMNREQSERGRVEAVNADLRRQVKNFENEMAAFASERDNLRQTFALHDGERVLNETPDGAKRGDASLHAGELEALATRFREVSDLSEERKVELVAAETRIERLAEVLRTVERASREKDTLIGLLRQQGNAPAAEERPRGILGSGVLPGLFAKAADTLQPPRSAPVNDGTSNDPAPSASARRPVVAMPRADGQWSSLSPVSVDRELHDLLVQARPEIGLAAGEGVDPRERVADIAAHVVRAAALAEGPDSPLAPLLLPRPDGMAEPEGPPDLAERIRRLAKR